MESAEGPWDFGARLRAALSDWDAPRLRELASRGADLSVRDAYGWPLPHKALALRLLPTLPSYPELREEVQGTFVRWRSQMEREEMERLASAPSRKSKPRRL